MTRAKTGTTTPLWGPPEVAEHLGISTAHVYRLVRERGLPFVRIGHLLRFQPEKVAEWIDSKTVSK